MTSADNIRVVAWHLRLREVHQRLRRALELAYNSLDGDAVAAELRGDLFLYCRGFCAALDGHHAGEDAVMFPAIAARHPELVPVLDKLRQDHSMLSHLITELQHAVGSGADRQQVERHLDGIGAIMESHFRYEESQLLGVLEHLALDSAPERALGPLA